LSTKIALPIIVLLSLPLAAFSQATAMQSAEKFFADVSAYYGKVSDYEALLTITQGKSTSHGRISYKSPMYLHIDFDDPPKQVFNFDGEILTFYSPANGVTLQQSFKKKGSAQVETMATAQGLTLMQRNYSVGYQTGAAPVPLDSGSKEMVTKLSLTSRGASSFSKLVVSVKDNLIRRIEGTQGNGDAIVLDFANIRVNQGVPQSRFDYSGPPDANVISDWLFDTN
jgi:outer membrane lipoprotein-sorting protein